MLNFARCSTSLMLSSHDWCYAAITLETVALDTPNNVAVFVTDASAKRAPTIFQNWTSLAFSDSFTPTVTQLNH
jgi:hypothetical protein